MSKAHYQPIADSVLAARHHDWNRGGRFRGLHPCGPGGHDQLDIVGDEISREFLKPVRLAARPPVFDDDGLADNIAVLA
jgi:hypothetical protein